MGYGRTDVSIIEQCQNALLMMSPRADVSSPGLLFSHLSITTVISALATMGDIP